MKIPSYAKHKIAPLVFKLYCSHRAVHPDPYLLKLEFPIAIFISGTSWCSTSFWRSGTLTEFKHIAVHLRMWAIWYFKTSNQNVPLITQDTERLSLY